MARRTVHTNARQIAERYRRRGAEVPRSIKFWLREAAKAVNRAALDNLRGGEKPGDYPVPSRTGDLLGSQDFRPAATYAVVFNTSGHAVAIHEGRGSSQKYGRRPYLDDAVDAVDPLGMMADGIAGDLLAVP